VRQAKRQGLEPIDIDAANGDPKRLFDGQKGVEALEAIAAVILRPDPNDSIDGVLGPRETTIRVALSDEWRHVVQAAARILARAVDARFGGL
jgi:hypothetical protein